MYDKIVVEIPVAVISIVYMLGKKQEKFVFIVYNLSNLALFVVKG